MISYFMRQDVRYCVADGRVVFLDLRNDRYSCLDARDSAIFTAACVSASSAAWDVEFQVAGAETRRLFEHLQEGELLSSRRPLEKPFDRELRPLPQRDLNSASAGFHPTALRSLRARFLRACIYAEYCLRRKHFVQLIAHVARRPRGHEEIGAVCAAARHFQRMRPYYPRHHLCLFDSLALIRFLSLCGLSADWVFGVHLSPFEAHCWTQIEDIVLDDDVYEVRCYTPIMST